MEIHEWQQKKEVVLEMQKEKMRVTQFIILILCVVISAFLADLACFATRYQTLYDLTHPEHYDGVDLSECYMSCPRSFKPDFERRKSEGMEKMKSLRVVFCSLCRNVAGKLPLFMERVERCGKQFQEYKVLIFENDSDDDTRSILCAWEAANPAVTILRCNEKSAPEQDCKMNLDLMYNYGAISPTRFEKMSYFRNQYMDYVQKSYADYDYMIVIDSDLRGPFSLPGLATCFTYDDWDAMAAMGLMVLPGSSAFGSWMVIYDVLAMRLEGDIEDRSTWTKSDYYKFFISCIRLVSQHKVGSSPFRVRSAFNGLCVYRMSAILKARYSPSTCEHIGFADNMAGHGFDKYFINPSLIVPVGQQGPPGMTRRWS